MKAEIYQYICGKILRDSNFKTKERDFFFALSNILHNSDNTSNIFFKYGS